MFFPRLLSGVVDCSSDPDKLSQHSAKKANNIARIANWPRSVYAQRRSKSVADRFVFVANAILLRESEMMSKLLHGQERAVFGDQAYWNESHRQSAVARGIRYRINRRPNQRPLSKYQRFINRRRSMARARVEHVFHVVKRLWAFTKVRCRGLAKNTAPLYTAFALANLYLLRRRLLPSQWTCAS
jgi:IS5 family transposase